MTWLTYFHGRLTSKRMLKRMPLKENYDDFYAFRVIRYIGKYLPSKFIIYRVWSITTNELKMLKRFHTR